MQKFLSVILSVLLLLSITICPVSAAEIKEAPTAASNYIRFNATGWNNVKFVYCHIWINDGKDFFGWGKTENTVCENVQGPIWQYDLSKLSASTNISGGIKSGVDYCVIFHADTGVQTYNLTFGPECIGDTAKMTSKSIENPVDSQKTAYEAVWQNNSAKYGPHKAITSIGNFIGSHLCPNNETPEQVIGTWIIDYPKTSLHCKPEEVVAKAMKTEFKTNNYNSMINHVKSKEANNELGIAEFSIIEDYLKKGYKSAFGTDPTATPPTTVNPVDPDPITPSTPGQTEPTDSEGNIIPTTPSDNSNSGPDGENDLIIFILLSIMMMSLGAIILTSKSRNQDI